MSADSKIEWTDATWNPVTGCTEVSPGCDHCYAKTLAERFRGTPGHYFERGFDVVLRPERLDQPLRWRKPKRIFVNSMSDLFHAEIPDEFIARVFAVMALAPQHTFQVLTKRHGRMRSLLTSGAFADRVEAAIHDVVFDESSPVRIAPDQFDLAYARVTSARTLATDAMPPLPNVWLGVSVEDQKRADLRIPALLETPAAVRFLSCEPLLGPVDTGLNAYNGTPPLIGWIIAGGESGHGARPMHPDWARSLRDQAVEHGSAFHFKQWGEYAPSRGRIERQTFIWPDGTTQEEKASTVAHFPGRYFSDLVPARPGWVNVERIGKRAAGRELDGRTWDEFPECDAADGSITTAGRAET